MSLFKHDFGTRFEIAYFVRDNSRAQTAPTQFQPQLIKDDYVNGVAGVDYTVPTSILGTTVHFNTMYVLYRRVGNKETAAGSGIVSGLPDVVPFDSDGVLYFEDRLSSKLKVTANTIYSFDHNDVFEQPGIQYSWTDNLKTTFSGDFFLGNRNGFFGQFYDNRRANFIASYSF